MDILTFELDSRCYAFPAEQVVQSCANTLTEDPPDVTRIDAKLLAIDLDRVDGSFLLEQALLDTAPLAAEKSIELAHGWEGEPAAVSADRGRIFQVFSNLVGNALKFTPAGGRILVKGRVVGDDVLFTVADTGSGIPPEDVPRLFDRFWQAQQTRRAGAGLGLYIA